MSVCARPSVAGASNLVGRAAGRRGSGSAQGSTTAGADCRAAVAAAATAAAAGGREGAGCSPRGQRRGHVSTVEQRSSRASLSLSPATALLPVLLLLLAASHLPQAQAFSRKSLQDYWQSCLQHTSQQAQTLRFHVESIWPWGATGARHPSSPPTRYSLSSAFWSFFKGPKIASAFRIMNAWDATSQGEAEVDEWVTTLEESLESAIDEDKTQSMLSYITSSYLAAAPQQPPSPPPPPPPPLPSPPSPSPPSPLPPSSSPPPPLL